MSRISDVQCISLERIIDSRGALSIVESGKTIPFEIKRVYFLYDIPGGAERGGHAHIELQQLIIAASGSFDITISDGIEQKTYHLNRSYSCIYMPSGLWRTLDNFSSGSVCLVLCSEHYSESDYIREYDEFLKYKEHR
jgi:dTDP-4-dehydrorhamnose 3,5-epimerase-like enzyme